MADPLSVAASIAGLLALSGTILATGYKYVNDAKDAPQELRLLLRETAVLNTLLDQLRDLASRKGSGHNTFHALAKCAAMEDCNELLGSIRGLIAECEHVPGQKKRNLVRSLVWPPKEARTQRLLARLNQLKDTFTAALTVDSADSLQRIESDAKTLVQGMTELQVSDEQRAMIKWICPVCVDAEESLETALKLQEPGTGKWLLEHSYFKKWSKSETNSMLWISGIPGCDFKGLWPLYFFCDHQLQKSENLSLRVFLYTTIRQLLGQNTSCMEDVRTTYRRLIADANTSISMKDLKLVMRSVLCRFKQVFIVLDALDECEQVEELTNEFRDLLDFDVHGANVRILVTSRKELAIERSLAHQARWHISLDHKQDLIDDIRSYISKQVEIRIASGRLKIRNQELKTEIISRLGDRAGSMFLWAKLQLDQLSLLRSDKAIKAALDHLPRGLDETYVRILQKIQQENIDSIEEVKAMLRWLVGSTYPLTLHELADVISIGPEDTQWNLDAIVTDPRDILSFCGSLVIESKLKRRRHSSFRKLDSPIISLAHLSVREYLTSSRILETPVAIFHVDTVDLAARLAETCVQYIGFTDFKRSCKATGNLSARLRYYPFLESASLQWYGHMRESAATRPSSESLMRKIAWFLQTNADGNFDSWQEIYHYVTDKFSDGCFPMYYAALFSLEEIVDRLLRIGVDINSSVTFPDNQRGYNVTALHIASMSGHVNVIKLLADKGASLDLKRCVQGLTPLIMAVKRRQEGAVETLVAAGANVHCMDSGSGATAFFYAVIAGLTRVVALLHAAGSNINCTILGEWRPLYAAIYKNHEEVFDQLLSWDVNLDVSTSNGMTPLRAAVLHRRHSMVTKLMKEMAQQRIVTGASYLTDETTMYNSKRIEAFPKDESITYDQKRVDAVQESLASELPRHRHPRSRSF